MKFFGFFREQILADKEIKILPFYEGIFANYYDVIANEELSEIERQIYFKYCEQASKTGKKVLELACGAGRVTINLAETDCEFVCVEKSADMIDLFRKKIEDSSDLKQRIKIIEEDIFCLELAEKFDLVILPATTISLLACDSERMAILFHKVYNLLNDDGIFVFDYGIDLYSEKSNSVSHQELYIDSKKYISYSGTFYDKETHESVLNILLRDEEGKGYMCGTSRALLSIATVYEAIDNSEFQVLEEIDDCLYENSAVRYVVLKK